MILPAAARDEEKQPTTQESMFNFVRISDGGIVRLSNVKSEVDIITDIATGVLGNKKIDFSAFKKHQDIRKAIGHIIPGFDKMSEIDGTKEEFQISNRTFHDPKFATHDNKAVFKTITIPNHPGKNGHFKMSSIRSEGQFNTIVYEDEDTFRGINQRWVVMMNQDDMLNLKLKKNDKVNLYNETGMMKKVNVQCFNIAKGNVATFFPEGNVLIPAITDPRSKTPSFKSTLVKIAPLK